MSISFCLRLGQGPTDLWVYRVIFRAIERDGRACRGEAVCASIAVNELASRGGSRPSRAANGKPDKRRSSAFATVERVARCATEAQSTGGAGKGAIAADAAVKRAAGQAAVAERIVAAGKRAQAPSAAAKGTAGCATGTETTDRAGK